MWQVVLAAAAAAGSGFLAKKLIHPNEPEKPTPDSNQIFPETEVQSPQPQDSAIPSEAANGENGSEDKKDAKNEDGLKIFRFSSPETGNKDSKKKEWSGFKGLKKNGSKGGKKSVGEKHSDTGMDQRGSVSGKKVSVCLKKRKTSKVASGKCESCASKDNSFGWGVGLGLMYMMSTGKAEISRLNSAMEETGKVVHELKVEIARRKSLCNTDTEYKAETNKKHTEGSYSAPMFTKRATKSKSKISTFDHSIEEGDCGSSGVTEDHQQPEPLDMDRLEAELESELQKLPWCTTDDFGSEGRANDFEAEGLARKCHSDDYLDSDSHQYNGVLPTELDNKLCHVLIEQQESQITALEAELHQANSRLHEKEVELQALKNCVKRLSEFSLAGATSDEENEKKDDVQTKYEVESESGFEPTKPMIGMKRSMGCDPQECS